MNKSHNHSYTDPGHEHGIYVGSTRVEYKGACALPGSGSSLGYWGGGDTTNTRAYSSTTRITIDLNGGTESRPQNTSIKVWKRVS